MINTDIESKIRLFTLANSLTENCLDRVESELRVDLGRKEVVEIKRKDYYLQFNADFRKEAKEMAEHYEIFYCLERSIRALVVQLMQEEYGDNWWDLKVPPAIKTNVDNNMNREAESGFTQRSEKKIDYTTFGELGQIVSGNWTAFDDLFKNSRAFQKIMTSLNLLRGPIAHCCPLAEDEIVRLEITVKDWFRLME
ncbi:Swt1 family HEPN domain-containing protein [Gynurincola endophyticus]|uniref:Swt1 family HEPN domain-containing protein n=1 Tax=Gynurincola endophyticus TaxID=2479004 RepID=UPI000F8D7946|nr:Swt1 family HEPN domain-containing protein [Gynurincola endophyticus]